MHLSLRKIVLLLGCMAIVLSGCSSVDHSHAPEQEEFKPPTPSLAIERGNEVVVAKLGEQVSLDGLSNYEQTKSYDGLTLKVDACKLVEKEDFFAQYPSYERDFAYDGWDQRFILVDITLENTSITPKTFALRELKIYGEGIKCRDSDIDIWYETCTPALAAIYGDLDFAQEDPGVSWGFPDGWDTIEPGQEKSFEVPFWFYRQEFANGSDFDNMAVSGYSLMLFNAYQDSELRGYKESQNCILLDLS